MYDGKPSPDVPAWGRLEAAAFIRLPPPKGVESDKTDDATATDEPCEGLRAVCDESPETAPQTDVPGGYGTDAVLTQSLDLVFSALESERGWETWSLDTMCFSGTSGGQGGWEPAILSEKEKELESKMAASQTRERGTGSATDFTNLAP